MIKKILDTILYIFSFLFMILFILSIILVFFVELTNEEKKCRENKYLWLSNRCYNIKEVNF